MLHPPIRIIVTCGPAAEPIDEVRCITNFSTGELGSILSDHFAERGWEVICLRGLGSTYPAPTRVRVFPFSTNATLEQLLQELANSKPGITAVFHAAALCDFQPTRIEDHQGKKLYSPKINSQSGEIHITLTPMPKVISKLRMWFPHSILVGWKYELVGASTEALVRGYRQIVEYKTDASVVNGKALGNGFALIEKEANNPPCKLPSKSKLCTFLGKWLAARLARP